MLYNSVFNVCLYDFNEWSIWCKSYKKDVGTGTGAQESQLKAILVFDDYKPFTIILKHLP